MTDLTLLEETLAVYGADASRWPEGRRDALTDTVRSVEGAAMIAEARALDGVLETRATVPPIDETALLSRIMGATVDAPGETGGGHDGTPQRAAPVRGKRVWIAGGLLAASLFVGVFGGLNGIGAMISSNGLSIASGVQAPSADDALLADLTLSVSDLDLEDDV